MAYYTKVLLPDETVRAVGRLHWAIYLRAWLFLIVAAIAGLVYLDLHAQGGTAADWPSMLAAAVGGVFLVAGLLHLLGAWVRRGTTEIAVTDRRIISKVGFIRRRTMEMNMNKVETVDVVQSIAGAPDPAMNRCAWSPTRSRSGPP